MKELNRSLQDQLKRKTFKQRILVSERKNEIQGQRNSFIAFRALSFREHFECSDLSLPYENHHENSPAQPAITCSKLTIETLEQGVKYVQS